MGHARHVVDILCAGLRPGTKLVFSVKIGCSFYLKRAGNGGIQTQNEHFGSTRDGCPTLRQLRCWFGGLQRKKEKAPWRLSPCSGGGGAPTLSFNTASIIISDA